MAHPTLNIYEPSKGSYTKYNFILNKDQFDLHKLFMNLKQIFMPDDSTFGIQTQLLDKQTTFMFFTFIQKAPIIHKNQKQSQKPNANKEKIANYLVPRPTKKHNLEKPATSMMVKSRVFILSSMDEVHFFKILVKNEILVNEPLFMFKGKETILKNC